MVRALDGGAEEHRRRPSSEPDEVRDLVLQAVREPRAVADDQRQAPGVRAEDVREPAVGVDGVVGGPVSSSNSLAITERPAPWVVVSHCAQANPKPNGSRRACSMAASSALRMSATRRAARHGEPGRRARPP